jgi:hypothetical protein
VAGLAESFLVQSGDCLGLVGEIYLVQPWDYSGFVGGMYLLVVVVVVRFGQIQLAGEVEPYLRMVVVTAGKLHLSLKSPQVESDYFGLMVR